MLIKNIFGLIVCSILPSALASLTVQSSYKVQYNNEARNDDFPQLYISSHMSHVFSLGTGFDVFDDFSVFLNTGFGISDIDPPKIESSSYNNARGTLYTIEPSLDFRYKLPNSFIILTRLDAHIPFYYPVDDVLIGRNIPFKRNLIYESSSAVITASLGFGYLFDFSEILSLRLIGLYSPSFLNYYIDDSYFLYYQGTRIGFETGLEFKIR